MKSKISLISLIFLFIGTSAYSQASVEEKKQKKSIQEVRTKLRGQAKTQARTQVSSSDSQESKVEFKRDIELSTDAKIDETSIEVPENSKSMRLNIVCFTEAGQVQIELYNPAGEKQGNFTVGTEPKPGKKERASGSMSKNIVEPEMGTWKVKIIPNKPKARVGIKAIFVN